MKYVLNLADDGRVLSAGEQLYIPKGATVVETIPSGDTYDYRYVNGEWIHDPLPEPEEQPTRLDRIEAQLTYNSIMLGTLMEV